MTTAVWIAGGLVAVALVWFGTRSVRAKTAATAMSIAGWGGVVACASVLQFGDRWGLDAMPVPVALGMAVGAAVAAAPLAGHRDDVLPIAAAASTAVAVSIGSGLVAVARTGSATPWPAGAIFLGVHWAVLAAAAASGVTAGLLALGATYRMYGDETAPERRFRARARDAATRAVVFLWVGWSAAGLVHEQFLATHGIGSRSEWFALGMTLLATGILFVGWDLGDERLAKVRSTTAPILVGGVIVAGLLLAVGFGSPFALSLGS